MARKDGSAGPFARITGLFGRRARQEEAARQEAEAEAKAAARRAAAAAAAAEAASAQSQPQTIDIADFVAELDAEQSPAHDGASQGASEVVADDTSAFGTLGHSYTIGTVFKSSYEFAGGLTTLGDGAASPSDALSMASTEDAARNPDAENDAWPTDGVVSISDLFGGSGQ